MANTISVNVVADVRNISDGINKVNGKLGEFGKNAGKVGGTIKGLMITAGVAFVANRAVDFLTECVTAGRESNKVLAQTGAVLKSTGGAAHITAKGVDELATSIAAKTGIDDESIVSGENMLLTFTRIQDKMGKGNDIFTQATKLAVDYSAATGKDMVTANLMLGKALNDPISGLTALKKAGVQFTDQQKDQITAMVKSGDTMGAQKIILKEFATEFGGSAEAIATPMGKLKQNIDNVKETIGQALIPVLDTFATYVSTNLPSWIKTGGEAFTRFKEYIRPLTDWIANVALPAIKNFWQGFVDKTGAGGTLRGIMEGILTNVSKLFKFIGDNPGVLAGLTGAIVALTAATWAYNAAMAVADLLNPFGWVALAVIAIGALAGYLIYLYKTNQTAADRMKVAWYTFYNFLFPVTETIIGLFQNVFDAVTTVVGGIVHIMAQIPGPWQARMQEMDATFSGFKDGVDTTLDGLKATMAQKGKEAGAGLAKALADQEVNSTLAAAKVRAGVIASITGVPADGKRAGVSTVNALSAGLTGNIGTSNTAANAVRAGVMYPLNNLPAGAAGGKVAANLATGIGGNKWRSDNAAAGVRGGILGQLDTMNTYQFGYNVGAGLSSGMYAAARSVIAAATKLASDVTSSINRILKFGSPSKVTTQMGKYIGAGLAVGMDSMTGKVNASATGLALAVAEGFSAPKLTLDASGSSRGTAGNTYHLTVNALDPQAAGTVVVNAIKNYESNNGASWRRA